MLHHYNYSTSLSQFLNYHQLEDQTSGENDAATPNSLCEELKQHMDTHCKETTAAANKSFTIAAILGLKNDQTELKSSPADLSIVNLSVQHSGTDRALVSNCSRLQLPVRHGTAISVTGGHYGVACPPRHQGKNYFYLNIISRHVK